MDTVRRKQSAVESVKSRQRVADHGEVFTPSGLVQAMLNLVGSETERIDSRFLEPACGSGNFLVPVLLRKLGIVEARYRKSGFESRHHALLALMSIYGIELLADNVADCRQNLLEVFASHLRLEPIDEWYVAAQRIVEINIVHGNALSMTTRAAPPRPISFAEWSYLGRGKFHRRDFRLDSLARRASFGEADTLFADLGKQEIFTPTRDYGLLSVVDIAQLGVHDV